MTMFELHTASPDAQRATFAGPPGSGKTNLVQTFLAAGGIDSAVIFDSKHDDRDWVPFARQYGYVITTRPADIRRYPLVIFRVDFRSLSDVAGWRHEGTFGWRWTEALQAVIERGETLVEFNEAMHTLSSRAVHPQARRIVTQGRSLGLPVWIETQEPLHVDTVALRESEHFFAFKMSVPILRRIITENRGVDAEELGRLQKHHFAYHRLGEAGWHHFTPVPRMKFRTRYAAPSAHDEAAAQDNVRLTSEDQVTNHAEDALVSNPQE